MKKIKTIEAVAAYRTLFSYYGSNNLNINYNSIENGNVASVSTAVNDFIKELEKNPTLVSTANTNEI